MRSIPSLLRTEAKLLALTSKFLWNIYIFSILNPVPGPQFTHNTTQHQVYHVTSLPAMLAFHLSYITCINICAQVKDPVVHVRVRWIMETLKHSLHSRLGSTTLSQLVFPGVINPNFHGRNPIGTTQLKKSKIKT